MLAGGSKVKVYLFVEGHGDMAAIFVKVKVVDKLICWHAEQQTQQCALLVTALHKCFK